jgi:DNA-binding SARP family transcriptional activator/tetratricopeptide (TPR) repeat protein
VQLGILGVVRVEVDGGPVALTAGRERAVLGLLALHAGQSLSFSRLVDSLWADPPPNARKAVQNYVARVRKLLPPGVIESVSDGYRFACDAQAVDAHRFGRLAASGAAALAQGHPEDAVARLAEALELWRGELLADAALADPMEGERTRYAELRRVVEEDLLDARLVLGQHLAVIPVAEAAVSEEPLRERRWGQLMTALYRAGRQADALRTYQRCRRLLVEELGIDPGPALQELERGVLEHDPRLLGPVSLPRRDELTMHPVLAAAAAGPIIGREQCRGELAQLWRAVEKRERRTFVLQGEPGAGKTRLVADLAVHALAAGGLVLYGRCQPELTLPYQPFDEAFAPLVTRQLEAEGLGTIGLAGGHGQAMQQYRLFQQLARLLGDAAAQVPVLLAIDDLHWSTPSTRRLLRYLADAPELRGVLLLVTARHTEGAGFAELGEVRGTSGVTLGPLTVEETRALIGASTTEEGPDAESLHRLAGGNPLLLSQLLHDRAFAVRRVPDVIASRLARLTPATRRVLDLAAVAGLEFDVSLLRVGHSEGAEALLRGVEEAEVAGLVVPTGGSGGFAFVHAIVRAAILDGLPAARRMRLHRDLAVALQEHEVDDRNVGVLAGHCAAAAALGLGQAAVTYARRAGELARTRFAFEEAATFYGQALEALSTWEHREATVRCDLLTARGEALRRAGDPTGSDLLRDAADEARRLADPTRLAAVVLASSETGPLRDLSGADGTVIALAEEAIAALGDTAPALRARLLSVLTTELLYAPGADERRRQTGSSALRLARQAGDARVLAQTLLACLVGWAAPEDLAGRVAAAREAVELAESVGEPELVAPAWHLLALALGEAGDVPGYAQARAASQRSSRDGHLVSFLAELAFLDAVDLGVGGDYTAAERLLGGAMDRARHAGLPEPWIAALQVATHTRMWWDQGRLGDQLPLMELLGDINPTGPFGYASLLAYLQTGDIDRARARLDRLAGNGFADLSRRTTWGLTVALAAEATTALDDPVLSGLLLERAGVLAGRVICASPIRFDVGHRIVGRLHATTGNLAAAQHHLDLAAEQCRLLEAPPFLARTLLDLAALARRRGNAADATGHARAARDLALGIGAGGLVAAADRLLATL